MANSKFILVRIIDTEYVPEEGGGCQRWEEWYDLDGGEDGSDGSQREKVQECVRMCEMIFQLAWWPQPRVGEVGVGRR